MPWWIYLICMLLGSIAGAIIVKAYFFPKWIGELVIAKDPDDPNNDYLFFRSYIDTKDIRKEQFITLKVVERK